VCVSFPKDVFVSGVECSWTRTADLDPALHGCIRLELHSARHGPLTQWHAQADLLWQYFGSHADSYTARITGALFFDSPLDTVCAVAGRSVEAAQCVSPFIPYVQDFNLVTQGWLPVEVVSATHRGKFENVLHAISKGDKCMGASMHQYP
jgi:hypothetical protein